MISSILQKLHQHPSIKTRALSLCMAFGFSLLATSASAEPDPNFHIYLMFGQSNMEGAGKIEAQDRVTNPRVKVMSDLNCSNLSRTYGNWYLASPPLNRCWSGLGPGDYFGKTMADAMPTSVTIGLVPAAISGIAIEFYQKSAPLGRNNTDFPPQFNGGYAWLLDMAQKAQSAGVIKGIIFHQGETNNGDPQWKDKVKEIVTQLRADLNIGDVPFLAGETLYADYQSCCSLHNAQINKLPAELSNSVVISAAGLPGADEAHFTSASYREFGYRYATVMLEKIDYTSDNNSSASAVSSAAASVAASSASSIAPSSKAASSAAASTPAKNSSGGGSISWLMLLLLAAVALPKSRHSQ